MDLQGNAAHLGGQIRGVSGDALRNMAVAEQRKQLGVEAASQELGGAIARLVGVVDEFEQLLAPITAEPGPVPGLDNATRRVIQHSEVVGHLREHTLRVEQITERIRDAARRLIA